MIIYFFALSVRPLERMERAADTPVPILSSICSLWVGLCGAQPNVPPTVTQKSLSRLVWSGLVLRIADALQTGEVTGPRVGHFSQLGEGAGLQAGIDGGHAVAAAAASMLCIRTRPVLC